MTESHPTSLPALNELLAALVEGQREVLGDVLVGTYLQGSFAAGDWDDSSDVDWLAAIARPLTEAEVAGLEALESRLFQLPTTWAQHLEGSYVPVDVLRTLGDRPTELWYLDNGSVRMERSMHDSSLVVRRVFREHGIALYGPPARVLADPVPTDALLAEVHAVFRDWAAEMSVERISTRWYQPFIVISYCRMLQTMAQGDIYSKRAGVEWGLAHLAPRWHGLIERAWIERSDRIWWKVFQPADPAEVALTQEFVDYATALADTLLAESRAQP